MRERCHGSRCFTRQPGCTSSIARPSSLGIARLDSAVSRSPWLAHNRCQFSNQHRPAKQHYLGTRHPIRSAASVLRICLCSMQGSNARLQFVVYGLYRLRRANDAPLQS